MHRIIRLTPAERTLFSTVVAELMAQRQQLFSTRLSSEIPADLRDFQAHYIDPPRSCFLWAQALDGAMLGNIAFRPYDHRFSSLKRLPQDSVEVVKLYVHPDYRRQQLATELFASLKRFARAAAIPYLYLHTHPALTGALAFWEKQGFQILGAEDLGAWSGDWRTVHLGLALD